MQGRGAPHAATALPGPALSSDAGRRQQLSRQVFFALHAVVRNARVHGEENAIFATPLAQLQIAIAELVTTDGAFELELAGDGLRINRHLLRLEPSALPLLPWVRSEMSARGLRGFSAVAAPPEAELRALVRLFTPTGATGPAGGNGQLQEPVLKLQLDETAAGQAQSHDARLVDCYSHSVLFVGRTIELLRRGGQAIPVWTASRLVQDLVDLQRPAPLRFLQLARTKAGGEAYWGYHAANVAVLSISFGARLGLGKQRRHDLGVAALFHDVGMAALPEALLHKSEELSDAERAALKASPLFAARAVLREREVHPAALERALGVYECHLERPPGALGKILAICEAYDALTTTRPWRAALSSLEALQTMKWHQFDEKLLRLFAHVAEHL